MKPDARSVGVPPNSAMLTVMVSTAAKAGPLGTSSASVTSAARARDERARWTIRVATVLLPHAERCDRRVWSIFDRGGGDAGRDVALCDDQQDGRGNGGNHSGGHDGVPLLVV